MKDPTAVNWEEVGIGVLTLLLRKSVHFSVGGDLCASVLIPG